MITSNREDSDAVGKNLKQSLESTQGGLGRFLTSLVASGMGEAIEGYQQLKAVLIQQRLWAHTHSRTELASLFQSIAKTAGEIHSIIAPYAEVMKQLSDLDKLTQMVINGIDKNSVEVERPEDKRAQTMSEETIFSSEDSNRAGKPRFDSLRMGQERPPLLPMHRNSLKIVELLIAHGPLSPLSLARLMEKDVKSIRKDLARLITGGVACRQGWGRGLSYKLTVHFIKTAMERLQPKGGTSRPASEV